MRILVLNPNMLAQAVVGLALSTSKGGVYAAGPGRAGGEA
jgi:hypothetical protein